MNSEEVLNEMSAEEKIEKMENELHCTICQDYFVRAYTLNCSHSFCCSCIKTWIQNTHECPLCRRFITGMTPSRALDNMVATLGKGACVNWTATVPEENTDTHLFASDPPRVVLDQDQLDFMNRLENEVYNPSEDEDEQGFDVNRIDSSGFYYSPRTSYFDTDSITDAEDQSVYQSEIDGEGEEEMDNQEIDDEHTGERGREDEDEEQCNQESDDEFLEERGREDEDEEQCYQESDYEFIEERGSEDEDEDEEQCNQMSAIHFYDDDYDYDFKFNSDY